MSIELVTGFSKGQYCTVRILEFQNLSFGIYGNWDQPSCRTVQQQSTLTSLCSLQNTT